MANTKSFILTYLDNYRGKEVTFDEGTQALIPGRLKHFATI